MVRSPKMRQAVLLGFLSVLGISLVARNVTFMDETKQTRAAKSSNDLVVVEPTDHIYKKTRLAPIVIESHKLIFFQIAKVGSSNWKKMFRRIMGRDDWHSAMPHDPETNGLRFLHQYNTTEATEFLNSPEYTRAIFVRDPKDRILSAFLDKVVDKRYDETTPCCSSEECRESFQKFPGFLEIIRDCHKNCCENNHWRPQSHRMEAKFLSKLDFIGHLETAHVDAKRLLQKIGAWEDYGQSGWGQYGNESFLETKSDVIHVTSSRSRLAEYYTPDLEKIVEDMYKSDYDIFNLPRLNVSYD